MKEQKKEPKASKIRLWRSMDRPYKLLVVASSTLLAVYAMELASSSSYFSFLRKTFESSTIFGPVFFPEFDANHPIQWKDRIQSLLLLVGLPVAFLLWHWRDKNVRDQIENSRKDTNLTEFLEVQKMASGLFEKENFHDSAKNQLQIAALHQLRGFLRGEYGPSFRQPAFELLMSGHADAMDRIGVSDIKTQIARKSDDDGNKANLTKDIDLAKSSLENMMSRVDKERIKIIQMEFFNIVNGSFSIDGKCFDFIFLRNFKFGKEVRLINSSFFGAKFYDCDVRNVNFEFSDLHAMDFYRCNLSETRFWQAAMDGVRFSRCEMLGTNLAIRPTAAFPRCKESYINDECWMASHWGSLDPASRNLVLAKWLEAGAVLVDKSPFVTDK